MRVDLTNFQAGGALNALLVSSPGSPMPTILDNDDNGSRAPDSAAYSQSITLAYNSEPEAGTGNDTNNTLDFGFLSNTPPTADNVGPVIGDEDATAPLRIAVTLSGNDADVGDAVESFTLQALPANGQLFPVATGGTALDAGAVIPATGSGPWVATVYFQPSADWNGATSFTYTAFDGDQQSAVAATASIIVNAVADIADDTATTDEDTAVNVLVLANDSF